MKPSSIRRDFNSATADTSSYTPRPAFVPRPRRLLKTMSDAFNAAVGPRPQHASNVSTTVRAAHEVAMPENSNRVVAMYVT